eukprot:363247_1
MDTGWNCRFCTYLNRSGSHCTKCGTKMFQPKLHYLRAKDVSTNINNDLSMACKGKCPCGSGTIRQKCCKTEIFKSDCNQQCISDIDLLLYGYCRNKNRKAILCDELYPLIKICLNIDDKNQMLFLLYTAQYNKWKYNQKQFISVITRKHINMNDNKLFTCRLITDIHNNKLKYLKLNIDNNVFKKELNEYNIRLFLQKHYDIRFTVNNISSWPLTDPILTYLEDMKAPTCIKICGDVEQIAKYQTIEYDRTAHFDIKTVWFRSRFYINMKQKMLELIYREDYLENWFSYPSDWYWRNRATEQFNKILFTDIIDVSNGEGSKCFYNQHFGSEYVISLPYIRFVFTVSKKYTAVIGIVFSDRHKRNLWQDYIKCLCKII